MSVNFFEKEKSMNRFINGNIFECEIRDYLRNNNCSIKDNKELPNVFYTLKNINNGQDHTYFYNEFDSVFLINNDVEIDKYKFRVNCKYENSSF